MGGPLQTKGTGPVANQRSSNSRLLAIGFAVLVVGVLLVLVIIRNADDDPAEPSPVATGQDQQTEQPTESSTPLTPEQLSSARLPLPLDVPEGTEAMAVRMNFVRVGRRHPDARRPGERLPLPQRRWNGESPPQPTGRPPRPRRRAPRRLPAPGPDSELVLPEMQVLAVMGPLPAANDGTLTMVLAVPSEEVPGLMPLADDSQLWFTLLPAQEEASEAPSDGASTEGAA